MTVRALASLTPDEIRLMARHQADCAEPMHHYFEPGSTQAITFERAFRERQREMQPQED